MNIFSLYTYHSKNRKPKYSKWSINCSISSVCTVCLLNFLNWISRSQLSHYKPIRSKYWRRRKWNHRTINICYLCLVSCSRIFRWQISRTFNRNDQSTEISKAYNIQYWNIIMILWSTNVSRFSQKYLCPLLDLTDLFFPTYENFFGFRMYVCVCKCYECISMHPTYRYCIDA